MTISQKHVYAFPFLRLSYRNGDRVSDITLTKWQNKGGVKLKISRFYPYIPLKTRKTLLREK